MPVQLAKVLVIDQWKEEKNIEEILCKLQWFFNVQSEWVIYAFPSCHKTWTLCYSRAITLTIITFNVTHSTEERVKRYRLAYSAHKLR